MLTLCAAAAVSRIDNLEFLTDVVPKTKTYRQVKEEKAKDEAASKAVPSERNGAGADSSRSINQMMQRQQQRHSAQNGESVALDSTANHGRPERVDDIDMTG